MRTLLILIICFFHFVVFSQTGSFNRISKFDTFVMGSVESNEGSIILTDGKELTGLVAYNDKTGILKFENGNDSRSLTARSVLGFEVYDPDFGENRIFYSLPGEDTESGATRPFFYELIKDFRSFAVLVRKEPVHLKEKKGIRVGQANASNNMSNTTQWTRDKIVVQQIETFYFLLPQQDPMPYFSILVEVSDSRSLLSKDQKTSEKFIDKDLFERCVGPEFSSLKKYAEEQNLSFKNKSDFLKILEFYENIKN